MKVLYRRVEAGEQVVGRKGLIVGSLFGLGTVIDGLGSAAPTVASVEGLLLALRMSFPPTAELEWSVIGYGFLGKRNFGEAGLIAIADEASVRGANVDMA